MKLFFLAVVVFLVVHGCATAENVIDKRGLIKDLLTGGNKGTASSYIDCCSLLPQVDELVNEANQLRLHVHDCQNKLEDIVNKLTGTTEIPFDMAKLTNVIKFPIEFAQRVAQDLFQFGASVIKLPYEIVSEISGWSFQSGAERERAKLCCTTMTGLDAFYTYVKHLRDAAGICEAKLQELEVIVDEILNNPEPGPDMPECPEGFSYYNSTKRCYAVFGNTYTYDEGQQFCGGVGGVLASIRSQDEQTIIESIIRSIPDSRACSCNRGGSCFATSGQTLDPNLCGSGDGRLVWKPQPGYYMELGHTNWKNGEPNCYGNDEHCIVLDSFYNYQWNDYSCTWRICPICEADPLPKRS